MNKERESRKGVLGRLFAFSLLAACYLILTNEAIPTLRYAEDSILVFRTLGMVAVFLLPTFMPTLTSRLLRKTYVRRALFNILLLGIILFFSLVMLYPQFLYSRILAFAVGLFSAILICFWITAFREFNMGDMLLYMPYIFLLSTVLTAALLFLPEPYHEYAVFLAAICAVVLCAIFHERLVTFCNTDETVFSGQSIPNRTLLQIFLISAGIGASGEVIRLLAFDSLYEAPDVLYMAHCAVAFLALLTVLCAALHRLRGSKVLPHIVVLVAAVVLMSVFASLFIWIGHQGLFVFMGNAAIFSGSILLPLLFAYRRRWLTIQMVGIVQLGLAIGVLASFLCKDLLIWLNLPVEIQIVALFLNSTLLCVALFTTIFGMRQTAVKTTQGVWMQTNVSPKQSAAQSFAGYLSEKGLTSRQAEVTVLAAKGYTVPAIAEGLVIAKKTVENHLTQAYKILDIHSKQELIKQYQSFDKGLR